MGRKKVVKEEIEEVKGETAEMEKVLEAPAKVSEKDSIEKIKKLKCNFKTFKTERDIAKMRVPDKCEICGKSFKEEDDMYVAWDKTMKEIFICKDCAEKD
jgi:hypothetical protein